MSEAKWKSPLKRKELIALILGRPFQVVAMSRADCSLNEIMRIKDLMKLFALFR